VTAICSQTRLSFVPLLSVLAAFAACTGRRHDTEQASAASDSVPAMGRGSEVGPEAAASSPAALAEAGSPQVLGVPWAMAPIRPTGHFNVKIWGSAANTHTLLDREGRGAVPVSEARFLWGDGQLYIFFYAGDLDLQLRAAKHDGPVWKDDSVAVTFFSSDGTKRVIQVSPKGVVADGVCPDDASDLGDGRCDLKWESGVRVGGDFDGTINKVGDFDEEWAVEAAVPLASLSLGKAGPGTRIRVRVSRCEVAYDGVRACGYWGNAPPGGLLVLEDRNGASSPTLPLRPRSMDPPSR
jgi:hypothetical protein